MGALSPNFGANGMSDSPEFKPMLGTSDFSV